MVNVNKLKGKIVENGTNVSELAEHIGINSSTLYRKLKTNCEDMSIGEVSRIIEALKLTPREVSEIFFNQNVA